MLQGQVNIALAERLTVFCYGVVQENKGYRLDLVHGVARLDQEVLRLALVNLDDTEHQVRRQTQRELVRRVQDVG